MKKLQFLWLVLLVCGQLRAVDNRLRVLYTANRQGEIAPCSCQIKQIGGLSRLAAYVAAVKKAGETTLIVDSGDSFFPNQIVLEENREKAEIKARVIAKAYSKIGVDVVLPGERDYALGLEFLRELQKETKAEFVSSNVRDLSEKQIFKERVYFNQGDSKVVILGLVDPETFQVEGLKVEDPFLVLEEAVKELKKEKKYSLIILSHLGLTKDHKILSNYPEAFVFGAHSMDVLSKPILAKAFAGGAGAVFQPFIEGQQIGDVRLQFNPSKVLEHQLVDLGMEYDKETEVTAIIKEATEALKQGELKKEKKIKEEPKSKHPFVANAKKCQQCHSEQYEFWKQTKHASAYLVLYAKNQHFDPDCIGCHSLGFQDEKGFKSVSRSIETNEGRPKALVEQIMKDVFEGKQSPLDSRQEPERYQKLKKRYHASLEEIEKSQGIKRYYLDVQCEHCHGNRDQHPKVRMKKAAKFNLDTCKTCHRPPNAPEFDPAKLPLVACPKLK